MGVTRRPTRIVYPLRPPMVYEKYAPRAFTAFYDVTTLGTSHRDGTVVSIHDLVSKRLMPEVAEWFAQNAPGARLSWSTRFPYSDIEVVFRDENEAFAFVLRWRGTPGFEEFSA